MICEVFDLQELKLKTKIKLNFAGATLNAVTPWNLA